MSTFIPDNILDQILDRCDIAEVISSYIPLKKAGRNFKALCPFHHEKTPSFIVNPDKGIFHCFGCGAGGNVFSFIMKYERLEFPEVAEMLAKKTGVEIPQSNLRDSKETSSLFNGLFRIHELAVEYFQNVLNSSAGRPAMDYLSGRGINTDTSKRFRIGFSTDSWDGLFVYLKRKGFKEEIIEKSGLIISRPDGTGYYDRFRNRLIFPIHDQRDKVIAFAGRVLDNSLPKYMNSPETPIYNKSKTLFGLNFAKKNISEKDCAVVVEGYIDLMMPYQFGVQNIIASCGTALTAEHVKLLKRHSRNVVIVYDPDTAGQMATLRTLDLLLAEDIHAAIVELPRDYDPDSFVRTHGITRFQELLERPKTLFEYKLSMLMSKFGSDSVDAKVKIAGEMLETISKVNNAILKSEYVKRLAESLKIDEDGLRIELKKVKKGFDGSYESERASPSRKDSNEVITMSAAEKIIIGLMIEDNSVVKLVRDRLKVNELLSGHAQRIVEFILRSHEENKPISYRTLIGNLDIDGLDSFLSEIAVTCSAFSDKRRNVEDCISWIKRENLKRELKGLQERIKEAQTVGERNKLTELVVQYNRLVKEGL